MKICLFGGTFDPPHIGHLFIAETVKEAEGFDQMVFVPAFRPPHKPENAVSPVKHRLAMLRLALKGVEGFELSDAEIRRRGISYSIETIREFKRKYRVGKKDICFLIGSDALLGFEQWKQPDAILRECRVLVVLRPGFRPSRVPPKLLAEVRFANVPEIEISSRQIRERIATGRTVRFMVADPVRKYIDRHDLYRKNVFGRKTAQ